MCHGHPRHHPCSHTSINWHYCPAALIDLDSGVETPCSHLSYATAQSSNLDCPLQNCQYKAMGGSWMCCHCRQGPNTLGWCTNNVWKPSEDAVGVLQEAYREEQCAHGCCDRCTRSVPSPPSSPEMTFPELRKGTASRKFGYPSTSRSSHRRGPAFSILSSLTPVAEKECGPRSDVGSPQAVSRVGSSASTAGMNPSRYGFDLSYARMGGSPAAGPRKHKSAGSASKGHGSKKHKVRAC